MSVLEVKDDLLKLIVNTDDFDKLKRLRDYFKSLQEEEDVNAEEERLIEIGMRESEEGKTVPRATVQKRINKILKK